MVPPAARMLVVFGVLLSGLLAAVAGFAQVALDENLGVAAPLGAGGLTLIAWVVFHPARVEELHGRPDGR